MKRLLKVTFDLTLLSLMPVLSWFILGLVVDKNLINVFSLIYPLQFVWYMFKSVFSTGANISKEKDKNKNAVMSGITVGSVVGLIVFGLIILNIDHYISFMNMEAVLYRRFAIYAVAQLYIQLVFMFFIQKLYYEEKNSLANKYSIIFNLLNFGVWTATLLIFENEVIAILITLATILLYAINIVIKEIKKFKLKFNILNFIKYDSVELFSNIAFFFIFLIGLRNVFEYEESFAIVLTFITLITDTQWDALTAISTVAKIDIAKNTFNYKKHRKNAYGLLGILLLSSLIMFLFLFKSYDLNKNIFLVIICLELVDFLVYPIYTIKICFLQLDYSAIKATANQVVASTLRLACSFLKTPYCTVIGGFLTSLYKFISINIMFGRNFSVDTTGKVINKRRN